MGVQALGMSVWTSLKAIILQMAQRELGVWNKQTCVLIGLHQPLPGGDMRLEGCGSAW